MRYISFKTMLKVKKILIVFLSLQISACSGQVKEKPVTNTIKNEVSIQKLILNQSTTFPQIHTNLNGMVREFVRSMHQDRKGNYWFGTNGDGIIRYDGQVLEKMTIAGISPYFRVLEIVEDRVGNIWFGTSEGLIKYDGLKFKTFSIKEGLPSKNPEIWGLAIDKKGLIWVGATEGVC
jgi:ligand-binding sensor domain-containing protein